MIIQALNDDNNDETQRKVFDKMREMNSQVSQVSPNKVRAYELIEVTDGTSSMREDPLTGLRVISILNPDLQKRIQEIECMDTTTEGNTKTEDNIDNDVYNEVRDYLIEQGWKMDGLLFVTLYELTKYIIHKCPSEEDISRLARAYEISRNWIENSGFIDKKPQELWRVRISDFFLLEAERFRDEKQYDMTYYLGLSALDGKLEKRVGDGKLEKRVGVLFCLLLVERI